ncbi:response regulator, partial [Fulvivirga sp. RKSG066]|uniref:response regulator n=1 Tax=Fulvivirga aurantia TaxID=2529383 RepID=UPI0012BB70CA
VAREVGTEGKLGGEAKVPNVAGTWKGLTDNVNYMASNLTTQVREIASVTTAVANGDLSQKISETGKGGEVLELSMTINRMVDALNTFADEVTNMAREVGTEGILGGQAEVPNVAGAWKDLTDNVNQMANNLTSQVRDIAGVSTALARGDFSRKIEVEAKGEVFELKNNINAMVDSFINIVRSANTIAKGDFSIEMPLRSEADQLGIALNSMTDNLRAISEENQNEAWIKTGQAGLNDRMRGEQDLPTLSKNIISYLTKYLKSQVGIIYMVDIKDNKKILRLSGSYAFTMRKALQTEFEFGESLVGQAAAEKETIVLSEIPTDYISISSGLGNKPPRSILVQPFMIEGEVKGVVEIGSFESFNENQIELVKLVSENIAIATNSAFDREKMKDLLTSSQRQSEELLKQQEKLKVQSEELQSANEELEAKTDDLEKQKTEIQESRIAVERKARELELASKYKSEFLANMSHELRTPLNSLLILAKEFAKNEKGNLDKDQVKGASIIYEGGLDLLNLINDILDLSKVEAGKLHIEPDDVKVANIISNLKNQFNALANKKELKFKITKHKGVPAVINTDSQRLEQIIKNLLSNAFKFTEKGSVEVDLSLPEDDVIFLDRSLYHDELIAISVTDTGIGISEEKQAMIFEAFQQAEGGTSRQYGGTGLGLTISRELTRLLGGEIHLVSREGEGSTFTIYIPIDLENATINGEETIDLEAREESENGEIKQLEAGRKRPKAIKKEFYLEDDRDDISRGDNIILIIEDDKRFAEILQKTVKGSNYKTLVAKEGKEGLELAIEYQPSGIILDVELPDINGLKVLDHLKFNLKTRHIPVHVVSVADKNIDSLRKGAVGFLSKPMSKKDIHAVLARLEEVHNTSVKEVLVIEDDKTSREAIVKTLKNKEVKIDWVANGNDALAKIKKKRFDCIILDLSLPDITGFEILKKLKVDNIAPTTPIIVYTGKELTREEVRELKKYTESIVIKGVSSPERLLDEVYLFLHSMESKLSSHQRKIITTLHDPEQILSGRKILLVDDDMRNTYALSKTLTDAGMDVVMADNGKMAIEKLKEEKNIELVLMDVMMPVMDGYEATKEIRKMKEFRNLPIISLTAKAMPEDKAKSLKAGANDYLTKPVDVEKLLNIMRVWLYK